MLQTNCPTASDPSLTSSVTQNRFKRDQQIYLLCLSTLCNGEFSPSAKTYLNRRFGFCPIGPTLLTWQKSNIKSPYMRPLIHVAQKPWRWRIQDWTISCQIVLLLTPGVGAVIQQLIEKQSLSQQLLWQFSNKQAENTHPCTPTSHTKSTVKCFFI